MDDQSQSESPAEPRAWSPWPLLILALALILAGVWFREPLESVDEFGELRPWGGLEGVGIYLAGFVLAFALTRGPGRLTPDDGDQPLCTHCLDPYREGVHFCPRCSCPTTVFAATGGYESCFAETWVLGKAARRPTHWIHVAGLGLVLAPWPLMVIGLNLLSDDWRGYWAWDLLQLGAMVFYACVYGLVFLVALKSWRKRAAKESTEAEYGHPPWWTYDRWWLLPEVEDAQHEEGTE